MSTAAAALSSRARRTIQHAFFSADAVRPDRAIAFAPANAFEERQFERLRRAGALHEVAPGRFWLDLPAYDALAQERFSRVRVSLILFALTTALLALGNLLR